MPGPKRTDPTGWLSRATAWTAGALLGLAGLAWTQEFHFHLRNGDRVTGVIQAEDTEAVTITNATVGRLRLPLSQITRREARAAAAAAPAPATNAAAATTLVIEKKLADLQAAYVAGQLSAEAYYRQRLRLVAARTTGTAAPPAAGATAPGVPATAVVNPAIPARAAAPRAATHLTGEILAGTDLAFSSKDRQLYTGRLKLNHAYGHLRNAVDYLFTYGRIEGELSANRMDGSLKSDYDIAGPTYLYNLGAAGYDEIRLIDSYYQIGPGVGYHLFKLTNFVASTETGGNYQDQDFADGRTADSFYFRFAGLFKWAINSKFSFDQKVEYFPQWDDFSEYKVRFEANLRYWLRSNLSLNLTVIDLYDTRVAPGVEPNDLQIRSSIGMKF